MAHHFISCKRNLKWHYVFGLLLTFCQPLCCVLSLRPRRSETVFRPTPAVSARVAGECRQTFEQRIGSGAKIPSRPVQYPRLWVGPGNSRRSLTCCRIGGSTFQCNLFCTLVVSYRFREPGQSRTIPSGEGLSLVEGAARRREKGQAEATCAGCRSTRALPSKGFYEKTTRT